jgi:cytochrome c nitrite reductase small subunit
LSRSGLLLSGLLGVLLGAGAYTLEYAEATAYLSDDPAACAKCHVMREHHDAWQKSSHHAVATCNDCHVPSSFLAKYWTKSKNGYRHSKGFTLQDFHEPIQIHDDNADVLQENCVRCHGGFVAGLVAHTETGDQAPRCVRCHGGVGHGAAR